MEEDRSNPKGDGLSLRGAHRVAAALSPGEVEELESFSGGERQQRRSAATLVKLLSHALALKGAGGEDTGIASLPPNTWLAMLLLPLARSSKSGGTRRGGETVGALVQMLVDCGAWIAEVRLCREAAAAAAYDIRTNTTKFPLLVAPRAPGRQRPWRTTCRSASWRRPARRRRSVPRNCSRGSAASGRLGGQLLLATCANGKAGPRERMDTLSACAHGHCVSASFADYSGLLLLPSFFLPARDLQAGSWNGCRWQASGHGGLAPGSTEAAVGSSRQRPACYANTVLSTALLSSCQRRRRYA